MPDAIILSMNANQDIGIIIGILLLILLFIFFSAALSGAEVAFFSLEPNEKNALKTDDSKSADLVLKLLQSPQELLATILITSVFVNFGVVILTSILLRMLIPELSDNSNTLSFIFEIIIITFIVVLIGEIIPKNYANKNGLSFAKKMAVPVDTLRRTPPVSWLKKMLVAGIGFMDRYEGRKGIDLSSDELEQAIALTIESGVSGEDQKILEGIVKLGNIDVHQIMRPRMDIVYVDIKQKFSGILECILESGYSRIPVADESVDNITGILYIKDLLEYTEEGDDFDWNKLIRAPFFVPENKKIDDLLKEFQEQKKHMAVVIDEYGGTCGIVTLEDILEEIVGDITEEFSEEEVDYKKLKENEYLFEARTHLVDFYKITGIDESLFAEAASDVDSIGGFIVEHAGRILKNKESVRVGNIRFIVESSNKKRIKSVRIIIENND